MAATSSSPRALPWALKVFWRLGAGQPMIVREPDEARLVGHPLGLEDRVVQRGHVLAVPRAVAMAAVGPVDVLDVPAVGLVALLDVLVERDVGVVLDRDLVVVVDQDEVAELLGAGDRGRLAGHALLEVAVAAHRVDEVVERRVAERGVGVEQAVLAAGGHRHPDGVADALAERAGRGLDAGGVAVLRVAGRLAAPGAQGLEVLQLEAPAAEVELDVERDARVAAREHEPVAARPVRVGWGRGASPSGTAGTPPAPGSSPCQGGRCRPSGPRPSRAP